MALSGAVPRTVPPGAQEILPQGVQDGLPPGRRGWAVAALVLAVGMATLDTSIANTALPTIAADLLASPIRVQLVVTVSLHQPREAARLACSGRPGVCEQAGSARLARGDGLLLTAEVSTGLPVPGTGPGRLRELVLDLDARL